MKEFAGKVAVITGGASGIGKAMALDFARRGMHLVLADVETATLEQTAQEVRGHGAEVLTVRCDVSDRQQVFDLADKSFERFGAVHVLCNNAGVAVGGLLQDATHEDWTWVLNVNLWGVIHGVEAFVPRLIAQQQEAHIVNTSSMAGLIASSGLGVYNTSKYAVVGLSETLRKDLRDHRIGVSVLCPMGVQTRITESQRNRPEDLQATGQPEDVPLLLGRYLEVEEVSRRVIDAIEHNEQYIPTHYEGREFFERRAQRILEAFDKLQE